MTRYNVSEKQITAPLNNTWTLKFKAQPTKVFFCYRQSNVRRLLPASDFCRVHGNQIAEHNSDKETVLGESRKLEGATEHLIDCSENHICRLSFEF